MKLKQIDYVLSVAKTGSFSKAADELYVSQPNISSAISSLEKELGYDIFNRTNQGISLTEEGMLFLKHATNILGELQKINLITEKSPYRSLTIESMFNHTMVSQAFTKLCAYYEDVKNLNFSIKGSTSRQILENIYLGKADLGVLINNKTSLDTFRNTLPNKSIEHEVLKKMNLNINLRKDHPLIKNGSLDFSLLHNFPHVNYNDNLISDFPDVFSMGLINPQKMISVTDSTSRGQLIIHTNAFGIGIDPHPKARVHGHIMSIPIPDIKVYLTLIFQQKQASYEELLLFKKFLVQEMELCI